MFILNSDLTQPVYWSDLINEVSNLVIYLIFIILLAIWFLKKHDVEIHLTAKKREVNELDINDDKKVLYREIRLNEALKTLFLVATILSFIFAVANYIKSGFVTSSLTGIEILLCLTTIALYLYFKLKVSYLKLIFNNQIEKE